MATAPRCHGVHPSLLLSAVALFALANAVSLRFDQEAAAPVPAKTPIILIPGDGGSQIEARLDGKPSVPHYWCFKHTKDFYPIWLNLELLNAFTVDCLVDNFRLVFDPVTNLTHNPSKVVTRVPGFGDTATIEYFDVSHIYPSAYFNDLTRQMVAEGYVRNKSLRGAPFDFRRGVHDNPGFQADLKSLIEATVAANGARPALLVAHSYGNSMALAMLQRQSPDWKRRHVRAWLALAAPLGGAVKTLRLMASGDSIDIPIKPLLMRPLQRSLTSTAYLMPHPSFWPASEVLVSRPGRNYSSAEYADFFADIGYPEGAQLRDAASAGYRPDVAPGVEVHCVYGIGVATPGQLVWRRAADWPDAQPEVGTDDGDGTVNVRSLRACSELWGAPGAQAQPVFNFTIRGASHLGILHESLFLAYARDLVRRLNSEQPAASASSVSADAASSEGLL